MNTAKIQKDLANTLDELKVSINQQKQSIETLDIPEENKKVLREQVAGIERSIQNGSMKDLNEVIKNLGQL